MALDGVAIAAIVNELNNKILEGRLFKIAEPEKDELLLTIKTKKGQQRLVISASASLPLIYISEVSKQSPLTAPNFCMLLRKHINNGKIVKIYQPSLERIINFDIEHYNDLGDLCHKTLTVELMGKHSNIIFLEENKIIDSIKHIGGNISSVREVLPGREYFIPNTAGKLDPFNLTFEDFESICHKAVPLAKALYTSITGLSPVISEEIVYRSDLDSDIPATALTDNEKIHLFNCLKYMISDIETNNFKPCVIYDNKVPIEFCAFELTMYKDKEIVFFENMSKALSEYYAQKDLYTRIHQKSADLRQVVQIALNKDYKKYDLQLKQLKDTEKKDKYKVYGELLTTYGYEAAPGAKSLKVLNYYTNEEMDIPLNDELTAIENAKKYFDRYSKLKRTYEALSEIIKETEQSINHLESVQTSIEMAVNEADLTELKEELIENGYIKRKTKDKKTKISPKPLHYISSDGFDIYVGKNNIQNEFITFKMADNGDWWFHAKGVPGSHVLLKSGGKEVPDSTFEDAGRLAAHYSKAKNQDKVDVDYLVRKNIKKPASAKPGFVIYHTNYSLTIDSDISGLELVDKK